MSLTKNPFDNEENLTSWFGVDKFYQNSKKVDLKKVKQTLNIKSNFFMSFKDSYTTIVNSITKHSITATFIMLLALGGVGASAAELVAPEEFKPSTIIQKTFNPKDFEKNTQKEKNPYTALVSDENNDVVISPACDLAIKYPKRYENKFNTVVYRGENTQDQLDYVYIFPKEGELESGDKYFGPSISCFKNKPIEIELINPMYVEVNPEYKDMAVIGKEIPNINVDYIKKNMGWFITEAELSSIRLFDNPNIPGDYSLYFIYNNIHYLIDFQLNDLKTKEGDNDGIIPVIKANQIQLQFNSLVENKANTEVIEKRGTNNSSSSSSTSSTPFAPISPAKLQTHTEKFLPNFKLNYPNDWKIRVEDNNSNSMFPNIPFKNITLNKGGIDLIIQVAPFSGGGCGDGGTKVESQSKLPNNITKFVKSIPESKELNFAKLTFVEYGTCTENGFIKSNLKSSTDKEYSAFVKSVVNDPNYKNIIADYIVPNFDSNLIMYNYYIRVSPTDSDGFIDPNNQLIPEIDQIIGQSVFK